MDKPACENVRVALRALASGSLPSEQADAIMRHVDTCAECMKEIGEMGHLQLLLGSEIGHYWRSIEPEPAFLERVTADLRARRRPARPLWRTSRTLKVAVCVAAVAIISLSAGERGAEAVRYIAKGFQRVMAVILTAEPDLGEERPVPPLPIVSIDQAQAAVNFPVKLPVYLPDGVRPVPGVQLGRTRDHRSIVLTGYNLEAPHRPNLVLLQTALAEGKPPLLVLDAWRETWSTGRVGMGAKLPRGRVSPEEVTVKPGVTGQWIEVTIQLGSDRLPLKIGNLLWEEDGVQYYLTGAFPLDELLQVAQSVRPVR